MKLKFGFRGLEETFANLEEMSKATKRNVARRTLLAAGQPIADLAARLAPVERGALSFSIVVSTQLTRRAQATRQKESEVEVYVGPAGGTGALYYASHQEFGTVVSPAHPYLRPAWESQKENALQIIISTLTQEVDKAAARAARKAARAKT